MQAQPPPQPFDGTTNIWFERIIQSERKKDCTVLSNAYGGTLSKRVNLINDCGVIIENIYTNAAMSYQLPACTLSYDSYTDSYWVVGVAHHVPLLIRERVDRVSCKKKFHCCPGNMYM
jgi:hypothetical protein